MNLFKYEIIQNVCSQPLIKKYLGCLNWLKASPSGVQGWKMSSCLAAYTSQADGLTPAECVHAGAGNSCIRLRSLLQPYSSKHIAFKNCHMYKAEICMCSVTLTALWTRLTLLSFIYTIKPIHESIAAFLYASTNAGAINFMNVDLLSKL